MTMTKTLLSDITALLNGIGIPVETGIRLNTPVKQYTVLTPIIDQFVYADDMPVAIIQEVRISLLSNTNYESIQMRIVNALLDGDFTITDQSYVAHDSDTGYHLLAIDVQKHYKWGGKE